MANSGPGPDGPPPGSPPGSPPPGYGAPGVPPPGYPAGPGPAGPPLTGKKTNPLFVLALGCGILLVFGGMVLAVAAYLFTRGAKRAVEQLPEIASGFAPPPAIPIVPAPIPADSSLIPSIPAGGAAATPGREPSKTGTLPTSSAARPATPSPSASASPAASAASTGMCIKAAACCRILVNRSPGGVSALAGNCDGLKTLTDAVCERQLETYRQGAKLLGATCP